MQKITAEMLEQEGATIRNDYSGRAMYGREVYGAVFDDMKEMLAAVARTAYEAGTKLEYNEEESEDILEDLENLSFDSMGRGVIIYRNR